MPDENLVRYLAPAALIVAALAILITWQSSIGTDAPSEPAGQSQPAEPTEEDEGQGGGDSGGDEGGGEPEGGDEPEAGDEAGEGEGETYTVRAGDSLSTIAAQTGVDVETLLELNPNADPQQLQAGDELELGP